MYSPPRVRKMTTCGYRYVGFASSIERHTFLDYMRDSESIVYILPSYVVSSSRQLDKGIVHI